MFEIGQMVVGVEFSDPEPHWNPNAPPDKEYVELGRIYTISGFCTRPHGGNGGIGVYVEEITPPPRDENYCDCLYPENFRPVRKTNIEELLKLVAPVKTKERA